MNLVDEEDCVFFALGLVDYFAYLLNPAADGAEGMEGSVQRVADDHGQGGFADAWRPPENHGGDATAFYQRAEHGTGTDQVLLADIVSEGGGSKNLG